jgi:membrane fusion protein, heavy metal efflux system
MKTAHPLALTHALALAVALGGPLTSACDHAHKDGDEHPEVSDTKEPERPAHAVTVYENGLELFMEYDAFVVGMESPLVAHFTDARDAEGFVWITKGRVLATLQYDDGAEETFVAETLLRNGIFKPIVKPTKAGAGTLLMKLEGEQMSASINAGPVVVHADLAAAIKSTTEEAVGEPTVGYLKEAQWKTQYATAVATPRVLMGGIQANGELLPVAGQDAELSAPVAGRIVVGEKVPFVGQPVKKGELLASIVPTAMASTTDRASIDLEKSRADAELGLAERELKRAEELFTAKAIPEKQLDAARAAVEVARARVGAAQRQLALFQSAQGGAGGSGAGSSFELRSPIDGVVSFARVTRGAVVAAGERVVSVVNADKLWLEAHVYEADVAKVESSPGAVFRVAGFDREFIIDDKNGRRVAVGAVVDAATRTVPIIFEMQNESATLKPGMYAKVTLLTGATVQGVAIPEQAVVDDNGQPTVFVMDGGESFFKRRLKLGVRSNGYVQVLEGVKDGERVVSRGAYEVKLATSAGGIPEHGHQH